MDENELFKHAKIATEIRQKFTDTANSIRRMRDGDKGRAEPDSEETKLELRRGYTPKRKEKIPKELLRGHEQHPNRTKRSRLGLSKVDADTRMKIASLARAKVSTHREISELFNV